MRTELLTSDPTVAEATRLSSGVTATLRRLADLGKARLSGLVVATTAVGYAMSAPAQFDLVRFFLTLLGTALAAAGANGLNQCMEADRDARMQRTRNRPVPSGSLSPAAACAIAGTWAVSGPALLAWQVNALSGFLAALTILIYLLVYTPLKWRTPLCTLVGAVSGAIPPVIGCAAASGRIGVEAWLLFTLLFVWQIPHFLSLAWLYRHDYAAGGFKMLPIVDESGVRTCRVSLLYAVMLVPAALVFTIVGLAGWVSGLGSILCGTLLIALTVRLYRERSAAYARRLFHGSLLYLPAVLLLLVLDRGPAPRHIEAADVHARADAVAPADVRPTP